MTTICKETKKGYFTGTDIPHAIEPKNTEGQLHGEVIWNYKTGVAKRVASYNAGQLITEKWFYTDGIEKNIGDRNCSCVASTSAGVNPN